MAPVRSLVLALLVGLTAAGFAAAQPAQLEEPVDVETKTEEKKAAPGGKAAQPGEGDTARQDEQTLTGIGIKTDGPALLDYFRKRTFPETDAKQLARLVKDLGNDAFAVREKAFAALGAMGAGATAGLKQGEDDPNTEIRKRVAELKERLEAKAEPAIQAAAARLIARAKPAGAADVLLAYLPFATDPGVVDEVCKTLGAVAVRDGKVDPVILKSVDDKLPLRRAAAGEALARAGARDQLPTVRKLLKDADPGVRLRVSLALVPHKEKEILPVMVDLIGELPPEQLWPVEEVLVRLAGDKTPNVSLGTTEATRKKARDAWQAWLTKHEGKLDLGKLQEAEALLGYTLIVQQQVRIVGGRQVGGEVIELDNNKKPRWQFSLPTYPVDAQVVGPDRVVIAEYQVGKVSERDFKGNVTWEKPVGGNPIAVQRLPNGNTFVVTQNRLVEFDRKGEETFSMQRPQHDLMRARKLRNGEVVFITNNGGLTRMEGKTQRVIKTFQVNQVPVLFGSIDVLPGGGVLVPDFQQNRVVEYDADGKTVKTFNTQWPNSAVRLPNGNTLISSQNSRRVIEFDRTGREVWSHQCDGSVFNARRR